jgi:sarcosine oxidase
MSTASRFVVVGAGLTGAATALQLARRGHEVTVLERTTPANHEGSSHGSARIFRYAYPDAFYAGLVQEARAEWDVLEAETGLELIRPTGCLDFGPAREPRRLAGVLERLGIAHELVTVREAASRWPQITFETEVLWHPGAGVIDAENSVKAMLDRARAGNAQIEYNWPVDSVERVDAGYVVHAADGRRLEAERVVVATGGWLADLLGSLALPAGFLDAFPKLEVMQEYAYHFPYREDVVAGAEWPTFIHKSAAIATYSLPGGRDAEFRGQKLAEYNGGTSIGTASAQTGLISAENRARIIDYVQHTLPGLVPEPYAETTCIFTNTPDADFVIDGFDGLTIASPCSGHGAKFAPLLGQIVADSALGTPAPAKFRAA